MIEPAMYFGIGFLIAALLAVAFIPLVHNRAVRLTMRRLEAATPLSMAEIQADKDQLRAEFAMSTRRLEMSVEQLKAKTTSQLAELGKKTDAINRLKVELGEKTATIFSLEAREKAFKDQLRATEEEYAVKTATLRETERTLNDKEAELAKINNEAGESAMLVNSQRVEIVSLKAQIDALKTRIGDYEQEIKNTEERLDRERQQSANATRELAEERGRVENLGHRVGELEDQLVSQTSDMQGLGGRVEELQLRVAEQGRLLSEREFESDRLRNELETARRIEADLRADVAAASGRSKEAMAAVFADKALLESELKKAQSEKAKLQSEIGAMKRDSEATWASERVENALLRERINDVAAEVARLTVVLEGPNSPIEAILAGEPVAALNGNAEAAAVNGAESESKGNLAERMRALQNRASRIATTTP